MTGIFILLGVLMVAVAVVAVVPLARAIAIDNPTRRLEPSGHRAGQRVRPAARPVPRTADQRARGVRPARPTA